MISIIAGHYKGKKLYDIKKLHVRPTQAKVRKSIFQILEPFENMKVLDLYAGVGTLGLEALSRGAKEVVFVENNRDVFKTLRKNINLFKDIKYELFLSDVIQYIKSLKNKNFDIIFADPPYAKANFENIREQIKHILTPGGIFCMEMKRENIDLESVRIKHYGSTQVVFWSKVI